MGLVVGLALVFIVFPLLVLFGAAWAVIRLQPLVAIIAIVLLCWLTPFPQIYSGMPLLIGIALGLARRMSRLRPDTP
ncbi:MAG: hypothetical protein ACTHJR_19690 [Sphingomonas sp.]|uniref:hypothetical protein n=1 Tax=Sphingomonas sp. TaxID=28214 RepID=UPI003F805475